ncbi:hypothetical protein YC2023_049032 [Brassica napus]
MFEITEPDDGSHEDLPPTTSSSPLETIATAFVSAPSFLCIPHNHSLFSCFFIYSTSFFVQASGRLGTPTLIGLEMLLIDEKVI